MHGCGMSNVFVEILLMVQGFLIEIECKMVFSLSVVVCILSGID